MDEQHRNLILACLLSVGILIGWEFFYEEPRREAVRQTETERADADRQRTESPPAAQTAPPAQRPEWPDSPQEQTAPQTLPGEQDNAARQPPAAVSPRVDIQTPRLRGSLALQGLRIDRLILTDYLETLDESSPQITLLRDFNASDGYYAHFGWIAEPGVNTPDAQTLWQADRNTLTPEQPVILSWENGQGLLFQITLSIDEEYMLAVQQVVTNRSQANVSLREYGLISRSGRPETLDFYILHEGLIGVFNNTVEEIDYDDLEQEKRIDKDAEQGSWLGITDKYWLTALIPETKEAAAFSFRSGFRQAQGGGRLPVYQADFLKAAVQLAPGQFSESRHHFFAGAKEVRLLDQYSRDLNIGHFDLAVDFGWLYFITKPVFSVLDWLFAQTGNFGVAILILTVMIRILFFPLAQKAFTSMGKMKKLQPQIAELRETWGDDRQKMSQEMMRLYKEQKVNPLSGCLPLLFQIPVFFALYKVLFVTIEMRHAPFFGWIHDLSAPDPLGILTVFGLVPWQVPEILSLVNIGIWPLIMGLTMYIQQKLNPPPPDPIQQKIFSLMPVVFTFVLGTFPAGLVIYWAWNNTLSIAQQWVILRRINR